MRKMKLIIVCSFLINISVDASQITVIGCGYVGLILAGVLADCGHNVMCVDIDAKKIAALNNHELPIYESRLNDLLFNRSRNGQVSFVDDLDRACDTDIFYICVGTPINTHGISDCTVLRAVFNDIVQVCTDTHAQKIICIKSTVPPGTIRTLHEQVVQKNKQHIQVVYNPEFMREGSALQDIYTSNPIVLGGESIEAVQKIEHLYSSFLHDNIEIIKTNFETAEFIKYAWNAFSAIRIAYVNELALLCRYFNADITSVVKGCALSEQLLPTKTIKPGPGYGGSCLPKDTSSFSKVMEQNGFSNSMVHQAIASNKNHIQRVIDDICMVLTPHKKKNVVTLLGLSFKANTNDVRNAPAIDIIKSLTEKGITIKAYDPQAMGDMQKLFPHVHYCHSPYKAIEGTDCIVVLTAWDEIKKIDFDKVALLCNKKIIIDTRNLYDVCMLKKYDFTIINMGVSHD